MPANKLNHIQWLRTIAVIEVMVWHCSLITKHFSPITAPDWYRPIGGIGVELFFIVSGFVMCLTVPRYQSMGAFLYARIARIYPMYALFTSLVIVAVIVNPSWRLGKADFTIDWVLSSYLILPQNGFPILGVGWSLEHEMIFYVCVALFTYGVAKLMTPTPYSLAAIVAAMGALGFALGTGPQPRVWDFHLFSPYMLLFAFGWAMCCSIGSRRRIAETLGISMAVAVAILLYSEPQDHYLMYRMLVAAAVFMLAIAARQILDADNIINRMASVVGDVSYSLYLSHWFILSSLGKVLGWISPPRFFDLPVRVLGIGACIAFAIATYRFIERPIDHLLRPRSPRQNQPVVRKLGSAESPAAEINLTADKPHGLIDAGRLRRTSSVLPPAE